MKRKFATLGTAAALALSGVQVSADESDAKAPAEKTAVVTAFDSTKTLSESELGEQRAKADIEVDVEDVTVNVSDQDGLVGGNLARDNHTGGNMIADGAFVNASGVLGTVQNTGNNVLIQHSTIINVSVEQ